MCLASLGVEVEMRRSVPCTPSHNCFRTVSNSSELSSVKNVQDSGWLELGVELLREVRVLGGELFGACGAR